MATSRQDINAGCVPVLCASCEARHRGICGALSPAELTALSKSARKHRADPGGQLVGDAELVERYANVLAGVVKLTKALSDGRQQIVGLQFAPDFLGRPFQSRSTLNAEAATEVLLCTFPRAVIERMLDEQPDLERRLLEQALKELDDARDWMVTLGRKNALEKVASFLLLIARNLNPAAGQSHCAVVFDLPLTRADIADFLGLTIETVSRQFTRLRADGVIGVENNRRISIANIGRLEARAGS